jgi:hypothetical protein
MLVLLVLVSSIVILRLVGEVGIQSLDSWALQLAVDWL